MDLPGFVKKRGFSPPPPRPGRCSVEYPRVPIRWRLPPGVVPIGAATIRLWRGNKRVALGSCLVFPNVHGYNPAPDSEDWENPTLAVEVGVISSEETTHTLRKLLI